jgi:hypothetical protein
MTIFAKAETPSEIIIVKGKDYEQTLNLTKSGSPVDLTGYSARMHIRSTKCDDDILIELSTTNGKITINGVGGIITLSISNTETALITENNGVHSLELTDTASKISPSIFWGSVIFEKDTTHD